MQDRIDAALKIAAQYGGDSAGHHSQWVVDQMVRALTGCPIEKVTDTDYNGEEYSYDAQGESEEYHKFLREFARGEDGPHTYQWSIGIAP